MRTPREQVAVAAVLLVLVGALLRVPALALPLGPEDSVLADAARAFAAVEIPDLHGRGPLVSALAALPVACGVDVVTALRLLGLAAGALAPALLLLVARRLGWAPLPAALAGLLLAVQPLWIAHAGGGEAGTCGLGVALALAGWLGGPASRAAALLALVAEPALWPQILVSFGLGLGGLASGGRARRAFFCLWAAGACAHVVLRRGLASVSPVALLLGVALLGALPLVAALPRGVRAIWRSDEGLGRGVLLATLLQIVAAAAGLAGADLRLGWDGLGALAPAAWGLALGVAGGLRLPGHAGDRRLALAGLALLALGSLWIALGPAQHALLGAHAPLPGRLHALGAAARLAAREAGPEGWVALDLGDETAAQARALEGLLGGRPVLVTPASGGATAPPEGWPPGGPITLALLTVRPEGGSVSTLGGWGIYTQEPAGRSGAYHVLRIRRP